jgi:hypothetical protein
MSGVPDAKHKIKVNKIETRATKNSNIIINCHILH